MRTRPPTTLDTPVQGWPTATCRGLGSPRERGNTRPNEGAPFMYCGRSLPPFTKQKRTPQAPPGPAAPHDATPPAVSPRVFPQAAPRTEREFARAPQLGPGLPRDQVSGPWLLSTAEARTINSSSTQFAIYHTHKKKTARRAAPLCARACAGATFDVSFRVHSSSSLPFTGL